MQHLVLSISECALCSLLQGSVGPAEVYTFFREIHDMWVKMGEYADLAIYDVVDELIDMVRSLECACLCKLDCTRVCLFL